MTTKASEPVRRPRKGHRAARYRPTAKVGRSRIAVELRRSIWPGFHAALTSAMGSSTTESSREVET